jgi:hypothetical protein
MCSQQTPGNIILWNLTTNRLRIVIHNDYGNPDHNGPTDGGGMGIDHLEIIRERQLPYV